MFKFIIDNGLFLSILAGLSVFVCVAAQEPKANDIPSAASIKAQTDRKATEIKAAQTREFRKEVITRIMIASGEGRYQTSIPIPTDPDIYKQTLADLEEKGYKVSIDKGSIYIYITWK